MNELIPYYIYNVVSFFKYVFNKNILNYSIEDLTDDEFNNLPKYLQTDEIKNKIFFYETLKKMDFWYKLIREIR